MQPLCDQNGIFFGCRSIGDWSATTIPKSRRPVEDRSATGGRLIANWLEMGFDWSATGWRLVVDRSAISWRLTIEQTICCVGVIMNKALINCYSMAISIYILIMPYCLFSFILQLTNFWTNIWRAVNYTNWRLKIRKKYQISNFQVNFSDWWLKYLL